MILEIKGKLQSERIESGVTCSFVFREDTGDEMKVVFKVESTEVCADSLLPASFCGRMMIPGSRANHLVKGKKTDKKGIYLIKSISAHWDKLVQAVSGLKDIEKKKQIAGAVA